MKSWVLLVVLITLATYSSGRTRFRMIEYDADVDQTRAYKACLKKCMKFCERDDFPEKHADKNVLETICMDGPGNVPWEGWKDWEGFEGTKVCQHLIPMITPPKADEPKRRKLSFQPAEIWRLFEN